MGSLVVPLLAGIAGSTVFGLLCGMAYYHVLVPFNDAFRQSAAPSFTGKRMAPVVRHTCKSGHEQSVCPCPPRRQRTMLEYQGADWRRRHDTVPGRYPLGVEVPVRISYRTNRAYPLTRITVIRTGLRGAALGAAFGLVYAVLLGVLLSR